MSETELKEIVKRARKQYAYTGIGPYHFRREGELVPQGLSLTRTSNEHWRYREGDVVHYLTIYHGSINGRTSYHVEDKTKQ